MRNITEIAAHDVPALDLNRVIIVDVRTQAEFAEKRLLLLTALAPLDELDPEDFALRHGILKSTPVYTLCASGNRAKKAAQKFLDAGFSNVYTITGGLAALEQAGVPISGKTSAKAPTGPISMERQVRIAAGALCFIFALLACFVSPLFIFFVFFIGAGLVFSGVTNWCGMALLLLKAPWNKGASCSGGLCSIGAKPGSSPGASSGGCQ